jgi:hypothetical protein
MSLEISDDSFEALLVAGNLCSPADVCGEPVTDPELLSALAAEDE